MLSVTVISMNEKKDNKQCLLVIRYHRTVMGNRENYYGEYKGITKWLNLISSHFTKKKKKNIFFCMTRLHEHAGYILIAYAKYQKVSVSKSSGNSQQTWP